MKKLICVLMVLLFLPACLEISEILQILPDGSVDFTFRVSIPEFPEKKGKSKDKEQEEVERDLKELFSLSVGKGLAFVDKKEDKKDGIKVFSMKLRADKISDLNQFYKKLAETKSGTKGKEKSGRDKDRDEFDQVISRALFKVKKSKSNTIIFTRNFTPPKKAKKETAKNAKKGDLNSKEISRMLMNLFKFRFEVFSPTPVRSTNARWTYGRDLRWETTLGYLLANPFQLEFEIESTEEMLKTYSK